jgi:hypothetical protein
LTLSGGDALPSYLVFTDANPSFLLANIFSGALEGSNLLLEYRAALTSDTSQY